MLFPRPWGRPGLGEFTGVGRTTHQLCSSANAALIFFTELSTSSLIMTRYLVRETVQRCKSFTDFSIFGPKIDTKKKKKISDPTSSFIYELKKKMMHVIHPKQTFLLCSGGNTLLTGNGLSGPLECLHPGGALAAPCRGHLSFCSWGSVMNCSVFRSKGHLCGWLPL